MKSTFCIVFRIKIVAFDSFLLKDKIILISYVSLKGLIYYFYHLTTLKHLKDLNMMFLDYLILLLYIDYTILRMEHNLLVLLIKCR
jgi:hypothetical protein